MENLLLMADKLLLELMTYEKALNHICILGKKFLFQPRPDS